MRKLILKEGYRPALSLRDTERAIKLVKDDFERRLGEALGLDRVSAPLIVAASSSINDDLSGVERKVTFDLKEIPGETMEIVQSLAKWKRKALREYGFGDGEGLYTDMNAVRRDDDMDNLHAVLVDQWDWEKVLTADQRTEAFLKATVQIIADVIADTKEAVRALYPALTEEVRREVYFITSQELEDRYPGLSGKEREHAIVKEQRTVFIMQIGDKLRSGAPHDGRAPDYDDWALNGDLLLWSDVLERPVELSSMGIRVNAESLKAQLKKAGCEERLQFPYHKGIVEGTLPLTIGGGIGQSRICLLLLEKLHIGEVLASVWSAADHAACAAAGIPLL
ncbi:MAG: aspartate--ammonia ligase [Clostridia bacterium]|nr:aspartate--ammonia ligase [Clostridia bacterium]